MKREEHLKWWNTKALEQQFYILIEYNEYIKGDYTRHPNTLTGYEISVLHSLVVENQ